MFFPLRDDQPSRTFPWVTVTILAINVLVYLYQAFILGDQRVWVRLGLRSGYITQEDLFIYTYGLSPCEVLGSCPAFPPVEFPLWATLFTSMFLHGSLLHIAGNMWYLWIFADNVEDAMGKVRFLLFYLLSGLAAGLAQILVNPDSPTPMVGASGAVSGVLGAYLILYPRGRVLTLLWVFYVVRLIPLPAFYFLGFWFLFQLLSASMVGTGEGGGVAWMAHIGGFVTGMLLVRLFVLRGPHRLGPPGFPSPFDSTAR